LQVAEQPGRAVDGDDQERRPHRLAHAQAGEGDERRHDQEAAADAQEAGDRADPGAGERGAERARRARHLVVAAAGEQHRGADDEHDRGERQHEPAPGHEVGEARPGEGGRDPGAAEGQGDRRPHVPAPVVRPARRQAGRADDGQGRPGRRRRRRVGGVDQDGHRQDRPAAPEGAEGEADQAAPGQRQRETGLHGG
jgi:hypothetical protein